MNKADQKFNEIQFIFFQARSFGYRKLANGTKLIDHVPHVAPEAWCHEIYASLSDQDI